MKALETAHRLIATFFGTGYAPAAPGTAATLATLPLYLAVRRLSLPRYLLFLALLTGLGTLASGRMEKLWGKDPGKVVIDEVAGTLITLVSRPACLWEILLGMALFRVFDILKPPPVSTLERLPGGAGIMADDVAAGILSALSLALITKAIKKPA
jgi:phosphatidylglycerophosphatase A